MTLDYLLIRVKCKRTDNPLSILHTGWKTFKADGFPLYTRLWAFLRGIAL